MCVIDQLFLWWIFPFDGRRGRLCQTLEHQHLTFGSRPEGLKSHEGLE